MQDTASFIARAGALLHRLGDRLDAPHIPPGAALRWRRRDSRGMIEAVPAGDSGLAAGSGSSFPVGIAAAAGMLAMLGLVASARSLVEARSRS